MQPSAFPLPVLVYQTLARLYNAELTLICTEDLEEASILWPEDGASLSSSIASTAVEDVSGMLWTFCPRDQVQRLLLENLKDEKTLVLCPSLDLGEVAWMEGTFSKHVVWVKDEHRVKSDEFPLQLTSNLVTLNRNSSKFEARDNFKVKKGSLRTALLATWDLEDEDESDTRVPEPFLWERRSNLTGVTLINSVMEIYPNIMWPDLSKDPTGFFADVINIMGGDLGFDVEWTYPPDGLWGIAEAEGSGPEDFSGVVGQLARREVDLCTGGLTYLEERLPVMDFSVSLARDRILLFVPAKYYDFDQEWNFLAFLKAFGRDTWSALVASMILCGITFSFVKAIAMRNQGPGIFAYLAEGLSTFYLSVLQLGVCMDVSRHSFKLLFLTISLSCYVVYASYTSHLTASMTVGEPSVPIKYFEDIIDHGYQIVMEGGSSLESAFKFAKSHSPKGKIFKNYLKIYDCAQVTGTSCLDQVYATALEASGRLVMDSESSLKDDPRFVELDGFEENNVEKQAIGLQKNSELLDLFDHQLVKMQQGGILDGLRARYYPEEFGFYTDKARAGQSAAAKQKQQQGEVTPLGLGQVCFPAAVLLGGALGGALVSLFEWCCPRGNKKSTKNQDRAYKMYQTKN